MSLLKNRVFILIIVVLLLGVVWIIFHGKFSEQNELLMTSKIIEGN